MLVKQQPLSTIRIIGGQWRGRKIPVLDSPGLRPTPNRIRETLFNWLAPFIQGANCLDCFTGSGALGLEALSRGANSVYFIDQSVKVIQQSQANLELLQAQNGFCQVGSIPKIKLLNLKPPTTFDIIFLDPPFGKQLIDQTIDWLTKSNLLAKNALIYIESELEHIDIPKNWHQLKNKHTGMVYYQLIKTN